MCYEFLCIYLKILSFRFRYSWYAFVSLLDLDFTSGFACPECGDCPDTVVMDGVSLDIRKSLMPWRQYIDVKNTSTVLDGRFVSISNDWNENESINANKMSFCDHPLVSNVLTSLFTTFH